MIDTFADVGRGIVQTWWAGLSAETREEVGRLCDERLDACFFGVVADERDQVVPTVQGGRFIATDDTWGFDEWGPSYFEHLLAHPELVLVYDPPLRTFHTGCTRHPAAGACWSNATIPASFDCPFMSSSCLMHPLRGRHIRWLASGERARRWRIQVDGGWQLAAVGPIPQMQAKDMDAQAIIDELVEI